ncbi:MAG: OmpH family outer membrane protein [Planctomycetaceae bacterium]|nr:OmpH family outer membrane protein [Planctomycetales bacterium]MCB9925068.1 OmpH family outer membrane protein [Planctomycetaceae bacterium]
MRISLLFATTVAAMLIGPGSLFHNEANAQGQTAPRGTNVAVVDVGYIFKNATRFKQAMDDIKNDDERFKQEVLAKQEAMQADVQNLQKMGKGTTDYKILEEKLAGDQTKLRLDMARKQKERVEEEAKIYFNAYRELEDHINKFATTYGIDLVLRFNGEEMDQSQPESVLNGINRFVVYQRDLNITGHILDQMNRGTPTTPNPISNGNSRQPYVPPRR